VLERLCASITMSMLQGRTNPQRMTADVAGSAVAELSLGAVMAHATIHMTTVAGSATIYPLAELKLILD